MQDFRVQTFLSVCNHLNYTRAAEELNITQPAVSNHINFLEQSYGVKLFNYQHRRLSLTPEGAYLYEALSTAAHNDAMLRDRLAHTEQFNPVRLGIGLTLTAGAYLVAHPLADFLKENPRYKAEIHSCGTAELLKLLSSGKIDCAFVEGMCDKRRYSCNVLTTQPLVAVCSPTHPLATQADLHWEDLLSERLLVREYGSGTRAVLEHALAMRNLSLTGFTHCDVVESLEVIKNMLSAGLGVSFLYEAAIKREVDEGSLAVIDLAEPPIEHDIVFIRLKNCAFEDELLHLFAKVKAGLEARAWCIRL